MLAMSFNDKSVKKLLLRQIFCRFIIARTSDFRRLQDFRRIKELKLIVQHTIFNLTSFTGNFKGTACFTHSYLIRMVRDGS